MVPSGTELYPQPDFLSDLSYSSDQNIYWKWGNAPLSVKPRGSTLGDSLGNCTWYAWGRMHQLGYNQHQLDVLDDRAWQWADIALQNGILVDRIPTEGSIAQRPGPPESPNDGHVAVVESVSVDGTEITVTESSYATGEDVRLSFLWRNRTFALTPASPYRFIHLIKGNANLPPIPAPLTLSLWRDKRLEIKTSWIASQCKDLDHDRFDLVGVSAISAQGGEVRLAADLITYIPPLGFVGNDSFTYTLQDTPGASARGMVSVIISAPLLPNSLGIIATSTEESFTVHLSFAGIPALVYNIETSDDLRPWKHIGEATAGPEGIIEFGDADAGNYSYRYYRTRREE